MKNTKVFEGRPVRDEILVGNMFSRPTACCRRCIELAVTLLFALSALSVSAQRPQKPQNEFSIYGGGGPAFFSFQKPVSGASSMGYGADAGVGFTGFLSPNWGLHVGVGLGVFNVKNQVNQLPFITPGQTDCEGYLYDLYTTLNDYKETHKAVFLSVPLMVQFQTKMGQTSHWKRYKRVGYYAMAGAKAQILFNYKYTSEIDSLHNMAYYPDFDNKIDNQPALGLGTFDGNSVSEKMDFGVLAMLAFETGAKWHISKDLFLYTGVYFDYGLNDLTQKSRTPYSDYNTPETITDLALLKFSDKTTLMAAGIKLRLAFISFSKRGRCPFPYP